LSQKLALDVGVQGPVTWAKMPKPAPIMTLPTKYKIQNFPILNTSKLEDFPLFQRVWTAL